MDGVGGKAGWRWIFIMEGIITIIMGLPAYAILVDFPEEAPKSWRFINEEDAQLVVARINADRRDVITPPFNLKHYLSHAKDWKIWFFAINFCMTSVVNYAVAYFLPIVLRNELGFSVAAAQCLNAPVSPVQFAYLGMIFHTDILFASATSSPSSSVSPRAISRISGT
jgi:MFS family permease